MNQLNKAFRFGCLMLLLLLASLGIGMTGVFLPTNRERYMDVEIKIEQVDERKEDELEEDKEK